MGEEGASEEAIGRSRAGGCVGEIEIGAEERVDVAGLGLADVGSAHFLRRRDTASRLLSKVR